MNSAFVVLAALLFGPLCSGYLGGLLAISK
jgi:hypothetical protein